MKTQKDYGKLLKAIAINVQRIRKSRGLTQEQMADLGFNYRHYQKLESGAYSPNLNTLHKLAVAFKVDVKEFFP